MRVLVISDVHGNADALKAVLESVGGWDYVWVLGDLVDYGPEPHTVIDMVRDLRPDAIVVGNHDYAVAYGVDCRCSPTLHELSVYTREFISKRLLSREQIEWLKSLPTKVVREVSGKKICLVHGSPRNPLYGYLEPNLPTTVLREQLSESKFSHGERARPVDAHTVLVGHTHKPMKTEVDGVPVLNPGSCGQPRDGDPRASFAIFDPETNTFTIHKVKYDVEKVIEKLKQLQLENLYTAWLANILRKGVALDKQSVETG